MLLVLLLLSALASAEECPIYQCGNLEGEMCISQGVNFNFTVQNCNETAVCTPSQQSNSYCVSEVPPEKYPGDYCYEDGDCTSENCTNYICQGRAENANCTNVYDCNPGLQCAPETLTCQPQLTQGLPCASDFQCLNNMICSLYGGSTTNCTEYLSVPNGGIVTRVDNAFTGLSLACASGFAVETENGYKCTAAPKVKGSIPQYCDMGSPCSDTTGKYSVPCQCGVNTEANAFCALFPGDAPVLTALNNLQLVLAENAQCNTYSRLSFNCFAAQGPTNLQNYYNFAGNFSLIMGNTFATVTGSDECLQAIYASDYYYQTQALANYAESQCPLYTCASTSQNWAAGQCWLLDRITADYIVQDLIYAGSCPNGQVCTGEEYNATCQSNAGMRYPGDPCSAEAPCAIGNCTNSVCIYRGYAEACENVYDCNAGFFCNQTSLTCQTQVGVDGYCEDAYDCANVLTCSRGKCIQYYSVKNGGLTDRYYENGYSEACASGFASLVNGGLAVCAQAPTSVKGKERAACQAGSTCFSSTNTAKECVCGLNDAGEAFCPYFEGDSPLQNAIVSYAAVAQNAGDVICNTNSRYSYFCYQTLPNMLPYFYYALNLTTYQQGHLIKSAKGCVAAAYAPTAQLVFLEELYQNYTPPGPSPPGPGNSGFLLTSGFLGLFSLAI